MTKFVLTAFAAVAIAAPAFADTPIDFTWEGHRIVGTVTQVGDVQVLKGEDRTAGNAFELRVKNGYVRGTIGNQLVSYPVPKRRTPAPTAG
ncbi:hypothetical protein [Sphingomonas crusticola]|uniref:hypothetical protein n=1 Tax=Sphingomonas crusticola TaxID=1697973 RepID=UPI000E251D81|nr:hypothetical protein [Sphingomonas crusticola]